MYQVFGKMQQTARVRTTRVQRCSTRLNRITAYMTAPDKLITHRPKYSGAGPLPLARNAVTIEFNRRRPLQERNGNNQATALLQYLDSAEYAGERSLFD